MLAALLLSVASLCTPQDPAAITEAELLFEGNATVSESALRKAAVDELVDIERNEYRRSDVDDAAFAFESYYKSIGYASARVSYRYAVDGNMLRATFVVAEGPRTLIESITAEGNTGLPAENLTSFFVATSGATLNEDAWYVRSRVQGAPGAIRNAYRVLGWLDARADAPELEWSPDKTRVRITVRIHEGVRRYLTRIEFEGAEALSTAQLQPAVSSLLARPFFPRLALEARARIEELYAEASRPDSKVEVTVVDDAETGNVRLVAAIKESVAVVISAVEISGNEDTQDSFIRSRIPMAAGDLYKRSLEQKGFRSLYATGLFSRIEITRTGTGSQQVLRVVVEEEPSRELVFAPGYGSYERLRGRIELRERNLFGTGRQARLEFQASTVGYAVTAGLTDPWLLGSAFSLDLPVWVRKRREPSFTREERGVGLLLSREWTPAFSTTFGFRLLRESATGVDSFGAALFDSSQTVASFSLEPRHDTRNDWFQPTSGHLGWLRLELAQKWVGSDIEYFRTEVGFSEYIEVIEGTVLAGSVRSAFIAPIGDTRIIPLSQRYFNGGEDTVRSFRESGLGPKSLSGEPVGGEARNILNLELRQTVVGNLQAALFFDYGNVGIDLKRYFDGFRAGVGGGVRYLLPVGAIRLDAGWNPDARLGENDFIIHFSVGMAF